MNSADDRDRLRALLTDNGLPCDDDFVDAWTALKDAELHVESHGFGADRTDELRMHVGLDDTIAGALTQDPITLDVTVSSLDLPDVAAEVVGSLPLSRPGRRRLTALDIAELLGESDAARRWSAWGQIDVFRRTDPAAREDQCGLGLVWMDVRGDGRYCIERGRRSRAIGVDSEMMIALVGGLIRRVRSGEGGALPRV